LTQEIIQLIDREADLLMRGTKEENLTGLRQRIATLFLQYIKTPTFNPGVVRHLRVNNLHLPIIYFQKISIDNRFHKILLLLPNRKHSTVVVVNSIIHRQNSLLAVQMPRSANVGNVFVWKILRINVLIKRNSSKI